MSEAPFSAAGRALAWEQLEGAAFDAIIIGGGITGTGVARELAGRGLQTALFESGDIGGGTSSRSSRLVHGGLRYLESFEFGLVFESLRERKRLLELAPHLVRPLPFLFPVFRGESPGLLTLGAGMWLYESLSLFRSPGHHRMFGRAGALTTEPRLRATGLMGGAQYYDANVDDGRLTLAVARSAHETGAVIHTYSPVDSIRRAGADRMELTVRDALSDRKATVSAPLVINAAGPWSDQIRRLADPNARPRLRPTKGVHILVERNRVDNRGAIIFRSPEDGRVMFVLPWGRFTYIGTTDTGFAGDPATAAAEEADIQYLLASANWLFPDAHLVEADVLSTWAGIRPLLAPEGTENVSESATSRDHLIWRDPSGLLNVAGGKLTTFRSMAAEVATEAARVLAREAGIQSGDFRSEYLPLPGAPENGVDAEIAELRSADHGFEVSPDVIDALVRRLGSEARSVLGIAAADPVLSRRIVEDLDYLFAEVVHAARSEMAIRLEDVMRRRLHLFYERRDGGIPVAMDVGRVLGMELGWDEARVVREVADYRELVRRSRPATD